jgi:hypothetical protein
MFFRFPPDAHWNPEGSAVEFSIGVGEYEGVVRVGRRIFQARLDQAPTPERCLEAYYLRWTRLELIAERKVRRRQLTDDGNVEITGRGLRERDAEANTSRSDPTMNDSGQLERFPGRFDPDGSQRCNPWKCLPLILRGKIKCRLSTFGGLRSRVAAA